MQKRIFVCYVSSTYHGFGVLSYLYANKISAEEVIIISESFFDRKPAFDFDYCKKFTKNIVILDSVLELEKHFKSKTNINFEVVLATPNMYPYRFSRILDKLKIKHSLLLLEEGIGTYGSFFISVVKAGFRQQKAKNGFLKACIGVFFNILALFYKKIYFMNSSRSTWTNFDIDTLSLRKEVVDGYKEIVRNVFKDKFAYCTHSDNSVVFISAPFCELNLIDESKYIKYVASKIAANEHIIVKPHPIESVKKYNSLDVELIDPSFPIEILVRSLDKKVKIYSFSSTAIYTLKLFFGFDVVRLEEYDFLYDGMSTNQKKIINRSLAGNSLMLRGPEL